MESVVSRFPGLPYLVSIVKKGLTNILKTGPVPKHIAFVMDGNRRYAKRRKQEVREGHNAGFEALASILELCYNAGVEVVTVFAFSIENFNRTAYEVESLMEIAKSKLSQLCEHGELAQQYGVRIRIIGDKARLPKDVLKVANRAENMTKDNTKATLNICFPYTSRDEIASSIRSVVSETKKGHINSSDINEQTLDEHMYLKDSPPLDILVRSSGVERLSDFMLWQCHQNTSIYFISKLWPEINFTDMFMILLKWSLNRATEQDELQEEEEEEDVKTK
jgi:ditrans,polycis-polyprenyl diphosphate synthase